MRAVAFAGALAFLGGCAAAPKGEPAQQHASYNRRELEESPGLFSGRTGEWTLYQRGYADKAGPGCRAPNPRDSSQPAACPAPKKSRTVLLPREGEDPDAGH